MEDKNFRKRAKYTLEKEIEAVLSLKRVIGKEFDQAVDLLQKRKGRIILTGVGKSSFIGMKISATLVSLGQDASFMHPVEALHGDSGIVSRGDVLIALSFSGESPEVTKIVKYLKSAFRIKVISITGNKKSSLAHMSDVVVSLRVDDEGCPLGLAPMASATATLVVGDLLASALTSPLHFEKNHFAKFHPGGNLGLQLRVVEELMISGKQVPLVLENVLLKNSIEEISDKKLGFVGVVNNKGNLVGIITDGDVRRFLSKKESIAGVKAKDAMTKKPKVIQKNDSLRFALELMEKYKITSLFVVDGNKPVGVVHMHAIVEAQFL